MKYSIKSGVLCGAIAMLMVACGRPSVPENAAKVNELPHIFPDYTEVTVPANICPLNFCVAGGQYHEDNSIEAVARLSVGDKSYTYGDGCDVIIDEAEWAELRDAAKGGKIKVEVFTKENDQWKAFTPYYIYIANEEIDPYISYRLIQPSYVAYEDLSISQRNLTNFDESDIYNNMTVQTEESGQCINCHSYKNYKTDHMLFHMRQYLGGTMLVDGGSLKKIDLKTDSTISAGVYPSWHPTKNLIAFSTNKTGQSFHTKDLAKIEVQDTKSDLILYDVDKNEVHIIANDTTELEVFPCWSADGKTLYYTSAHFEYRDTISQEMEMIQRYKDVRYNLYKRSFNPETYKFGDAELLYDAAADSMSVTLPRVSPDGKYLVFARAEFGCFHVWHRDADIFIMDLASGEIKELKEINSKLSESYPSFSSNSRWIMTDSRRDDGNYTRPYIAYFTKDGKCCKPFELPQRDPHFYTEFVRSYNRPEFMSEPVKTSVREFASKAKTEAVKANLAK